MRVLIIILSLFLLVGCAKQPAAKQQSQKSKAEFVADSAYRYVAEQVAFGPRTIGSEAHNRCVDYLYSQLQRFGAEVELQHGEMLDYADHKTPIVNIIARYNPQASQRILLAAHYDSRPWADHDADIEKHNMPISGANDGASGVGVLLEIARQLSLNPTDRGIDIVLFDAEDMGAPEFYTGKEKSDDWCLGSQWWATQCKREGASGEYSYGIVLDMVGAGDAVFPCEYFSMQFAAEHVRELWQTATRIGYGRYFSNEVTYPITDDHYYVNTIAGIPCVDIIHYTTPKQIDDNGFCRTWHTTADNLSNISPATLDAVGTTVMTILKDYSTK